MLKKIENYIKQNFSFFLGKNSSFSWPVWLLPSVQKNHKNYIVSLANLCRWLAEKAEKMGVEGRKFIEDMFNWELVTKNFIEIMESYLK